MEGRAAFYAVPVLCHNSLALLAFTEATTTGSVQRLRLPAHSASTPNAMHPPPAVLLTRPSLTLTVARACCHQAELGGRQSL